VQFECELQDAVDSDARHHRLLGDESRSVSGNIMRPRTEEYSPSVFSRTTEVDVAGLAVGERDARRASAAPAQIDVLVELAPEFYEASPTRRCGQGFSRPADCAE